MNSLLHYPPIGNTMKTDKFCRLLTPTVAMSVSALVSETGY